MVCSPGSGSFMTVEALNSKTGWISQRAATRSLSHGLSCIEYTVTASLPKWKYLASIAYRCENGGLPCVWRAFWQLWNRTLSYHLKCPQIVLHRDANPIKTGRNFISRKFSSSTYLCEIRLVSSTLYFVLHPEITPWAKASDPAKQMLSGFQFLRSEQIY